MMYAGAPNSTDLGVLSSLAPAYCGCHGSWGAGAIFNVARAVPLAAKDIVSPMLRWRGTDPALRAAGVNTLIWTADQVNSHDRHVPIAVKADITPPPTFPTTPTGGTILVLPAQEW